MIRASDGSRFRRLDGRITMHVSNNGMRASAGANVPAVETKT
jgi:hypothetical protein